MILAYGANGGPGGGDSEAVDLFLVSLGMVVVSLLLGALCVVTTCLTMRTAGMTAGPRAGARVEQPRDRRRCSCSACRC